MTIVLKATAMKLLKQISLPSLFSFISVDLSILIKSTLGGYVEKFTYSYDSEYFFILILKLLLKKMSSFKTLHLILTIVGKLIINIVNVQIYKYLNMCKNLNLIKIFVSNVTIKKKSVQILTFGA